MADMPVLTRLMVVHTRTALQDPTGNDLIDDGTEDQGNDTIISQGGYDTIYGRAGDDLINLEAGINAGNNLDTCTLQANDLIEVTLEFDTLRYNYWRQGP